jgi:hypothetical protein
MLVLISKKKEEGMHIIQIEDFILYGFRKNIESRFKRELNEESHLNLSYFLRKKTNFRTVTEEYNLKNRPVLKSMFVYYVEKKPKQNLSYGIFTIFFNLLIGFILKNMPGFVINVHRTWAV